MQQLKQDAYFKGIDWAQLSQARVQTQLKLPKLQTKPDLKDKALVAQALLIDTDYTAQNRTLNRVKNYTFVR